MTQTIPKTASDPATLRRPSLFYRSAREGMRDFLEHALTSSDDGVLLPGFIGLSAREGSGVLDPVVEVGARVGFYDLDADLTIDLDEFERALSEARYSVVVVIHYFGRSETRMAQIRALTDAHGALLVEDLAHGFFTAQVSGGAGRAGHLNLFSLHKMFPFEDGGMVQYSTPDLLAGQASTRPELAQRLLDYDWQSIANVRRDNFKELTSLLRGLPEHGTAFRLLWPALAEGDVPQTLPVRIEGAGRDDVYFGMNEDGYGMVSLYHTLIEQARDRFPNLVDVSRHIINFPVHQDSSPLEFAGMVASFRRHLEASRATQRTGGSS